MTSARSFVLSVGSGLKQVGYYYGKRFVHSNADIGLSMLIAIIKLTVVQKSRSIGWSTPPILLGTDNRCSSVMNVIRSVDHSSLLQLDSSPYRLDIIIQYPVSSV